MTCGFIFSWLGAVFFAFAAILFLVDSGIWQQLQYHNCPDWIIRMLEGKSGRPYSVYAVVCFVLGFFSIIITLVCA